MHILEIPSFFPPYGGEFCLEQTKALKGLGHEVRILSNIQLSVKMDVGAFFFKYPYHRSWTEQDGVEVFQSFQRGIPKVVRPNVRRWISIVSSMFDAYVARYGCPDILHAHCAKWAGYAAMQIAHRYHIKYVITEHLSKLVYEPELGPVPSHAWQIPMLKEAYERAAMVIPVSEELVDNISGYFGKSYQWRAISNVIDTAFYHEVSRPDRTGRTFKFCCLANFIPLKGYDVLFEAFRKLQADGIQAELHIAGRGTDSQACLSQLSSGIISHGLLDKSGVRQLLYDCDALILASRSEVQPLALMEAMSTGMPVVSTEVTPQSLRFGEGCLIVPVDDVDALADAMKKVMNVSPSIGHELSARIAALASPSSVARQLDALFNEVLASS